MSDDYITYAICITYKHDVADKNGRAGGQLTKTNWNIYIHRTKTLLKLILAQLAKN